MTRFSFNACQFFVFNVTFIKSFTNFLDSIQSKLPKYFNQVNLSDLTRYDSRLGCAGAFLVQKIHFVLRSSKYSCDIFHIISICKLIAKKIK